MSRQVLVYGWRILFLGAGLVALLTLASPVVGVFVLALGVQRLGWQLTLDLGVGAIAVLRVAESLALIGGFAVVMLAIGEITTGDGWVGWMFFIFGLCQSLLSTLLLLATFRAKEWWPTANAPHGAAVCGDSAQQIQP
jgi:hypothetical protein